MAAMAALGLVRARRLARVGDIACAMSLEALQGSLTSFHPAIHAARPHAGQVASAANVRLLLEGSAILESHRWCDKVQDAYSLRCAAQVHGASRDLLDYVERTVAIEINAATDNPLVLLEEREIVSNGNFHGQPVAFALDCLAIAVAELANISERRVERMVNPSLSDGLPAFLTREGGINSGMMILQYVSAALVSENKVLAHPASVDSIPTSAGQEDHVSMGNAAGLKALQVLANAERLAGDRVARRRAGRRVPGAARARTRGGSGASPRPHALRAAARGSLAVRRHRARGDRRSGTERLLAAVEAACGPIRLMALLEDREQAARCRRTPTAMRRSSTGSWPCSSSCSPGVTGGDPLRAAVVAVAFFVVATAWTWWRFRVRIRERDAATSAAAGEDGADPANENGRGSTGR